MISGHRILIIEDSELISSTVEALLSDKGFEVEIAKTAEEGFQKIRARLPSLIYMDVNLPDMDGMQLCRLLRKDPATRYVPILVCTAHARSPEQRAAGLRDGADDYLLKPFQPEELFERVHALLRRVEMAEEQARQKAAAPPPPPVPAPASASVSAPASPAPDSRAGQPRQPQVPEAVAPAPLGVSDRLRLIAESALGASSSPVPSSTAYAPVWLMGILSASALLFNTGAFSMTAFLGALVLPAACWLGLSWSSHFALSVGGNNIPWESTRKAFGLACAPLCLGALLALLYAVITGGHPADFTASPLLLLTRVNPSTWGGALLARCDTLEVWAAVLAYRTTASIPGVSKSAAKVFAAASWLLCAAFAVARARISSP
ncbi:MAG: response regulator transcription factor [Elusimicrobia bacterium]|nr:response regulator transcription factor [Elusimicrobiota bacterium]